MYRLHQFASKAVICTFAIVVIATDLSAQTAATAPPAPAPPAPPFTLEIMTRQGDFYWVVRTYPDGSRVGGWMSVPSVEKALRPIPPASPSEQNAASGVTAPPPAPQPTTGAVLQAPSPVPAQLPSPRPEPTAPTSPRPTDRVAREQIRKGFWFNGGLGVGSLGCDGCEGSREIGPSGGLSLGGTISDRFLIGVGTTGWAKTYFGEMLSVGTLDARVRFYPVTSSGFFITGGLGAGSISIAGESEVGAGAVFGVGWDIRVARNVSLTPFYNGFAMRSSLADANVSQIGLGVTIH